MPEEPRGRRPRFKLTGLESSEELLERLRDSTAEVEILNARIARLAAEKDALSRRLQGVAGLTDDELAAELPRRMTQNLAAAREVAQDMLERARNDAMLIRLDADQVAVQLVDRAKAEAARIVRGTMAEAKSQVAAARAEGSDILRAAHAQRTKILAELDERAARAETDRQRLQDHRNRLEQAYDQVARVLADARAAMANGIDSPPAEADRSERPSTGRTRHERQSATGDHRGDHRGGQVAPSPRHEEPRPVEPFDGSRAAAPTRNSGVPPVARPAFGPTPYVEPDVAAG